MGSGGPAEAKGAEVRRGEVWWADLPKPVGRRPVVLVSRDEAYAVLSGVTVAEVTSTIRGIRSEVPVGREEGLRRRSVINTDNLHTVPKRLLTDRIGRLQPSKLDALASAIEYSLALTTSERG